MTENMIALSAQSLTTGYGGDAILKGLDLDIPKSKFTALIGPNGCGKSTLLKCFSGLLRATTGHVFIGEQPIAGMGTKALARRIAILAQFAEAPEGLTVSDLVRQGRYPHRSLLGGWTAEDSRAVEEALQLTGMGHLATHKLDCLSGGQRQRAWIAMTLAQDGEILLLDEPTTYLDLAHQIEVLTLVRRLVETRSVTVVAVLHDINQAARFADQIVLLKKGRKIAEGPTPEILRPDLIEETYGIPVRFVTDPQTNTPLVIPEVGPPARNASRV